MKMINVEGKLYASRYVDTKYIVKDFLGTICLTQASS